MKIEEVKGALKKHSISVEVRPTKELFPNSQMEELTHFSLVCQSYADQRRVHHWIEFYRPGFEGFDLWAAYVEAIIDGGRYSSPQPPSLGAQERTQHSTLKWFRDLSDDDLIGVTNLEILCATNGVPERTRALLVVLADRLKDES